MKIRIWLTATFLILLPVVLNAQIVRSFGLKFGGANTKQTWKYSDFFLSNLDLESRLGLDIALFFDSYNLQFVSVVMEGHDIQKGMTQRIPVTTEENPDGTGEFLTFKPRVDYLSFPILAKLNVPASLSPYIIAGPRFDIRIGQEADGLQAVYDHLKRFDVGATFGVGMEISKLTAFNLLAEIRYSPSLTNIFENDSLTVKNKSIEFLVGFGF